jgi:hypothetical protein
MISILKWGYFRLKNIYLCFGLFAMSFFRWPFGYGVWSFMRLFCPRWLCEWLQLFFWSIVQGYVPPWISHLLSSFQFLALEKKSKGICPIVIGEVPCHLIAYTLCRTPTLAKCGGEAQHLEKLGLGVLRDSWMFRARQQGEKHLALSFSWCHWKGLET